ncbi:LysR family transcriptional regulator [Aurantiacibacter rhizosphaerae]|uniref:LysR family transcriptional regulator n=1 Tax=Aurantiacibacter rhizosphaerae TaxID=2691582 RepID=A0A844X9X6_9SPHN|nr:LysR family transcriptional regulator [Aurantiacibacter rhizosphaerae]MWV27157.1 LysR family transcriptional regulator [Aurantiacibacter rhizosphaerae]
MDNILNLRTFLTVSRLGSFAAAARAMSVAPSVVSKRIGQLEHELHAQLFHRSTRELKLSEDGSRLLPRCMQLVTDYDEMREDGSSKRVSGLLRIESPGSVAAIILGPLFCEFLNLYPAVDLDLRLSDRLDNPLSPGFDVTIGTRPSIYEDVTDYPLMPYPCAAYASREYVQSRGSPDHPKQLNKHDCLVSLLHGKTWHFYSEEGDFALNIKPRMMVNDATVLRQGVLQNLGIAILPTLLVQDDVDSGRITTVLPNFRPSPMWIKAQVHRRNSVKPSVRALIEFLKQKLGQPDIGPDKH